MNDTQQPQLSIIMPCFNERATIHVIVEIVLAQPFSKELIIVDDASRDGTPEVLDALAEKHPEIRVIRHPYNRGKGAALRIGIQAARGDIVLIQDADMEYDPNDYRALLAPILADHADVVFGSRFQGGPRRVPFSWHTLGNLVLTLLSNMVTGLKLTDMETCYKVFRREVIQSLTLEEERFGVEPEITIKLSVIPHLRISEVPVSYRGRTYEEGKKIGMRDGFRALYVIGRYALKKPALREEARAIHRARTESR